MSASLTVEVVEENGLAVAKLTGELGLAVADLDREFTKIMVTRPTVVIMDMSGVTLISSLGMGLFVRMGNAVSRVSGRFFVFGAKPAVMDAFHRARLDGLFEVRGSLAECLESAGRPMPAALAGN